mmetsp:Transcript_98398/g.155569  ORF Transcript_98398/g.155569 Transcript_98398/m.155569 type:complete len:245 (+) Transcript_98398:375-1109(+)
MAELGKTHIDHHQQSEAEHQDHAMAMTVPPLQWPLQPVGALPSRPPLQLKTQTMGGQRYLGCWSPAHALPSNGAQLHRVMRASMGLSLSVLLYRDPHGHVHHLTTYLLCLVATRFWPCELLLFSLKIPSSMHLKPIAFSQTDCLGSQRVVIGSSQKLHVGCQDLNRYQQNPFAAPLLHPDEIPNYHLQVLQRCAWETNMAGASATTQPLTAHLPATMASRCFQRLVARRALQRLRKCRRLGKFE